MSTKTSSVNAQFFRFLSCPFSFPSWLLSLWGSLRCGCGGVKVGRVSDLHGSRRVVSWVPVGLLSLRSLLDLLALPLRPMVESILKVPLLLCSFFSLLSPPLPALPCASFSCPVFSSYPAFQKEPVKACPPSTGHIKTFGYPLHHVRADGRSSRKINSERPSPAHHSTVCTGWCLLLWVSSHRAKWETRQRSFFL